MSVQTIVDNILNKNFKDAKENIQQELLSRSYGKIQEMKPSVMRNQFDESRQLKDPNTEMLVVKDGKVKTIDKKDWKKYEKQGYGIAEGLKESNVKTVKYRGFNITVHKNRGGMYTAKNDSGEPYTDVPQFRTPEEAIKWDKKNVDQMLDESVNLHEALTKGDKKTIDAFYNKKEDDSSSMVNSTGTVLKKVGFGGAQDIAKWEGNKVKITATMDDRQTQEVVRYIKKTFPRNQLLDESVNLHEALTKGDKKTIDAFYNKKEDDSSSMVNSTGTVLKKVGFAGAQDIAKWEGNKVKITATMDDRQTQEVVRYIKKTFPRNVIQ